MESIPSTQDKVKPAPPETLPVEFDNVPNYLKSLAQWAVWRFVYLEDRWNKIPHQARNPTRYLSVNDESMIATFDEAKATVTAGGLNGISFVLKRVLGSTTILFGIDIDGCVKGHHVAPEVLAIISKLGNPYWELSPSMKGVRVFTLVTGEVPDRLAWVMNRAWCKKLEVYCGKKALTVTGLRMPGAAADLTTITFQKLSDVLGLGQQDQPGNNGGPLTDDAILFRIRAGKSGHKFDKLWAGDISGYAGDSEADFAMACMLARYTHDGAQIRRIMQKSGLVRAKWQEPRGDGDWLGYEIAQAIAKVELAERTAASLTDRDNAQRFADQYRENVRYCFPTNTWLIWRATHWAEDTSGEIMRMAKGLADQMARDPDENIRQFAKVTKSAPRLYAMVDLAKSERDIPTQPENRDRDPMLFNVMNGTIDLRTGALRPHNRDDLITKVAPLHYDPSAQCPSWEHFLNRVLAEDTQLIRFVQQWLGYCLTGDISEQYLPIFHGQGNNGKNVLLDTVCGILGPYACEAAPGLLEASDFERHPTEIWDLMGRRLVTCSETEGGRALRISFVKRATGNATLKGRKMRQDFVEFTRTHKMILVTNNKPIIREDTEAVWRRIRLLPFNVVIPKSERDPHLTEKLKAEWPGILAWMVHGCLDWQRNGLIEPPAVEQATEAYRLDENAVAQFVKECCAVGAYSASDPAEQRYAVPTAELWQRYKNWCECGGHYSHNVQQFSRLMKQAVPTADKQSVRFGGKTTSAWIGIRMGDPEPRPQSEF